MRGLEDALARIARRDELRDRTSGGRGGAHRVERPESTSTNAPASPPATYSAVSPVVEEVAEALRAVVRRNPGVFATVVVQEADTAWSVWIGEWDGTLRTRVTRLEPDAPAEAAADTRSAVPAPEAAPEPEAAPAPAPAGNAAPVPAAAPVPSGAAVSASASALAVALVPDPAPAPAPFPPVAAPIAANATADRYTGVSGSAAARASAATALGVAPPSGPAEPLSKGDTPTVLPRPVIGPAMNDRVALRIAELLRREAARETRGAGA